MGHLAAIIVFVFFLFPETGFCQKAFNYLGIEKGLSNNSVNTIFKDKFGFMWFGTDDGLNQYDGYGFKIFRNDPKNKLSLVNNQVVGLTEDMQGRLWIATKRGLSVFYSLSSSFFIPQYRAFGNRDLKKIDVEVYALKAAKNGDILIGTAGAGLLLYDHITDSIRQIPFQQTQGAFISYSVRAVKIVGGQAWLILGGRGLCNFNFHTQKIKLVLNNPEIVSANCMEADRNGTLWIGTDGGLIEYQPASGKFKEFKQGANELSASRIYGVLIGKDDKIWLATDGGGVNIYDVHTGKFSYIIAKEGAATLSSNAVTSIFKDNQSRTWIGTLRGGVNILDEHKNKFNTILHIPYDKNSLISDYILSFCEDAQNRLFVGTDGAGLSIWDRARNTFKNYIHEPRNSGSISSNNVTSMICDHQHVVWIATFGGGINRFDPKAGTFKHYECVNGTNTDNNVWKLFLDSKNNLWAGTCLGNSFTYRLNRKSDKFEPIANPDLKSVIAINEDRNGNLWFGTFNRLIKLDNEQQTTVYDIAYPIRSIFLSRAGNLWIGTQYAGLLEFDSQKGNFKAYTEADGLSNNSVLNIEEDDHANLWMSTFNGISEFSYKSEKFNNFYQEDGLQSNLFNYNASLHLKSGEMVFGGIRGFNIFQPDSIRSLTGFPHVWLTSLRILNNAITPRNASGTNIYNLTTLTVPFDQAVISFSFTAPEYSSPLKIAYAYYLEGLEKKWNFVGSARSGSYSRLSEGTYYLHIKSTDVAGVWNRSQTVLKIIVLPPWYRTWWAYFSYLLIGGFILYYFNKYKIKQMRMAYQVEQATQNAEKERELNERKLSFFTNISHEFRTPLTLIINPVKDLLYNSGKNFDVNELSTVYLNAQRLLSLVDQLLLFRKVDHEETELRISKLDIVRLCKDVFLCFTSQARLKKINFSFLCESEEIEIFVDREKMEIVLFNILSNAFKFTAEHGEISFTLIEAAEHVDIHITDNGQGIPTETGTKLFEKFYQVFDSNNSIQKGFGIGLYLANKFVDFHKGNLSYASELGKGTDFYIKLLKGTAHFHDLKIYEVPPGGNNNSLNSVTEWQPELIEAANGTPDEIDLTQLVSEQPTILVVDDNENIRTYLKKIFKKSFIIHEASDGEEGLKLAEKHIPDIIISDVTMPVMDGMVLCAKIKSEPSLSHIPVILLTSSTSSEIKLKGIECGADDYITKPFESDLLVARILNILKRKNSLQRYFYNEITLQSDDQKISPEYKEFLAKCISVTEAHLDDPDFNAKTFAEKMGMSHSAIYKRVKSISGRSINEFIRFIRLRKAAELLIKSECRINEAAFQAGFNNQKYFREQFIKLFEMTPSDFIRKYRKSL